MSLIKKIKTKDALKTFTWEKRQHNYNIDTKNKNLKAKTRWKDGVIHPTLGLKNTLC
jgi:hypothetical protein